MARRSTHSLWPASPLSVCTLVALLGWTGASPQAGQLSVPFTVNVILSGDNSGICRSTNQIGAFGATVTIVCATGAAVDFPGNTSQLPWGSTQDGAFRYLTLRSATGELLGSLESHTSSGVTNSWNVVKLSDREYLEFMVSW